jgi:hypothetical protein
MLYCGQTESSERAAQEEEAVLMGVLSEDFSEALNYVEAPLLAQQPRLHLPHRAWGRLEDLDSRMWCCCLISLLPRAVFFSLILGFFKVFKVQGQTWDKMRFTLGVVQLRVQFVLCI